MYPLFWFAARSNSGVLEKKILNRWRRSAGAERAAASSSEPRINWFAEISLNGVTSIRKAQISYLLTFMDRGSKYCTAK